MITYLQQYKHGMVHLEKMIKLIQFVYGFIHDLLIVVTQKHKHAAYIGIHVQKRQICARSERALPLVVSRKVHRAPYTKHNTTRQRQRNNNTQQPTASVRNQDRNDRDTQC